MKIRNITEGDIGSIREFVDYCKPLDLHTHFTYWILAKYFRNTCFVIEEGDRIIAYTGGVRGSVDSENLYLWQIGIAPEYRGKGYFAVLLDKIIISAVKLGCKTIQFSMILDNGASYNAFLKYAQDNNIVMNEVGKIKYYDSLTNEGDFEKIYEYKLI
jgi:L-2,4-diaminobutyric acid acetyltransferase